MNGKNYYVVLITKNGRFITSSGSSLYDIDIRTIKYDSKSDLIDSILKKNPDIKKCDVCDVEILMKYKDGYKRERGPYFKKDSNVVNRDFIRDEFIINSMNKSFVLEFVSKYKHINNFRESIGEIEFNIKNGYAYDSALRNLYSKISKTYKGMRGIYSIIMGFKKNSNISKEELSEYKQLLEQDKSYSDDEMTLKYLIEHDRELLDIEDFNGHESISPFDGSRNERCR